jgi:hypothetical protein
MACVFRLALVAWDAVTGCAKAKAHGKAKAKRGASGRRRRSRVR